MEVASLVISIFAVLLSLIIAGYGIYIQFNMYRATTGQLGEMKDLVGQLHGLTDRLVEIQQHQFDKMLDAFVTHPGTAEAAAEKAGASASESQDVIQRLNALQEAVAGKVDAERLRDELARISAKAESAAIAASDAARLAQRATSTGQELGRSRELVVQRSEIDFVARAMAKVGTNERGLFPVEGLIRAMGEQGVPHGMAAEILSRFARSGLAVRVEQRKGSMLALTPAGQSITDDSTRAEDHVHSGDAPAD